VTTTTIAVMLGTLPIQSLFALWALHPTSPLTFAPACCFSQWQRLGTAHASKHIRAHLTANTNAL